MINEVLQSIQTELKAPKGQFNSFGKYKYRSCEDILEAVKPLLAKYNATLTISDDIVFLGDRYYVKATSTLRVGDETISTTAFAREEDIKKGMDASQITGASSSYSRKYSLNGLFCIDDTKDADTDDYKIAQKKPLKSEKGKDAFLTEHEQLVKDISKEAGKISKDLGYSVGDVKKKAIAVAGVLGTTDEELKKILECMKSGLVV